jgi:hypothetical protein
VRLLIFIFTLITCTHSLFGQRVQEHYFTFGINAGMLGWAPSPQTKISGNRHYSRTTNGILGSVVDDQGRARYSLLTNTTFGLTGSYMFRNGTKRSYTAFFAEVQANRICYSFEPPFYFSVQGDTFGGWIQTDRYLKYGIGAEQTWYRGSTGTNDGEQFFYARLAFSQTNFHRNFDRKISLGYTEDWRENGRGMVSRIVAFNPKSFMLSGEFGIRNFAYDRSRMFDFGVALHVPFKHTYTEQYEFYENNIPTGKGELKYLGAIMQFTLRYSFNFELPEPKPKPEKPEENDSTYLATSVDTAGMMIDVQGRMKSGQEEIEIVVWDKNEIDGDRITLIVNGQVVLSDYTLKRRKKVIKVKLQPGKNYIVMRAENLGTKPPNTAAVEIRTKDKRRNVTLVSDKEKSGAIEVTYNP